MGSERELDVFFLPFMAHGHMIPTADMAKLFAMRGVKTTIITTPLNAPLFTKTIQKCKKLAVDINLQIIKFPAAEAGLPEGCENVDQITSDPKLNLECLKKFIFATSILQEQVEQLLQEFQPNCLVADKFFPWATDAAAKFGIPRLVFHGSNFFSMCAIECVSLYEPYKKVSSDSELFVVPDLPGEIKLTASQIPDLSKEAPDSDFPKFMMKVKESELKSFGTVFNSFYELEPAYVDYYREVMGWKAWHVGPVSLSNMDMEDKSQRGKDASISETECLQWLEAKKPNSVIYICFGSVANFRASQLKQIATGLEASGHDFIWVVRKDMKVEENEEWSIEEFEKRMRGKGLIIRGWAPQILILDHEAVGGFVTHCGWNSTLEGITAGKAMVTWPVAAEQFYNEKLVTQVLKTGVSVGVQKWVRLYGDNISSEAVEKAVRRVMVGEEAEEIRKKAKELGELARKAVEEGGSSYSDLTNLIQQLKEHQTTDKMTNFK